MKTYKFETTNVFVRLGKYKNGRPAIFLIDAFDLVPFTKASINVVKDDQYKDGEVVIKNYSENVGMLDFLVENGIVTKPHRWVETGYVVCPVVYLTDVLIKQEELIK